MTDSRAELAAPTPPGGWQPPWTNVFELADALPTSTWTLVGGLMVQGHSFAHDVRTQRPTSDTDILLHVEVNTDAARLAHASLTRLGYRLQEPFHRKDPHYRYLRGTDMLDLMVADHAAPRAQQRLVGRSMFPMEGGTQALRRTLWLSFTDPRPGYRISVPDELGALVLKGAAYMVDRRDRDRHLFDATVLAACLGDIRATISQLHGSDQRRIRALQRALSDLRHPAWMALRAEHRSRAQDSLRILASAPVPRRHDPPPAAPTIEPPEHGRGIGL